ncbi:MAG: FtsQ-type POTRA domain-containing protein [Acidobacteriota bacterium]
MSSMPVEAQSENPGVTSADEATANRREAGTAAEGRTARRDEQDNVVPFRRGSGDVRPFRRSPLRKYLQPFVGALAIVGLPTAFVAWIMLSPRFALVELTVESGTRVPEVWVRQTLKPLLGTNLPLLSLRQAESLLHRHPWVLRADLRKELPGRLIVTVTEKRAVALLRGSELHHSELHYIDIDGATIAPFDPLAGSADLLLVSREGPAEANPASGDDPGARSAVRLAEEIAQTAPHWSAGLSEIVILGEEDFRVYTSSLPFPLLVRAGTLQDKARRLEALLPQITERYGAAVAIDLRFARRIIVQPSAHGRASRSSRPGAANFKAAVDHVQLG